MIMDYDDDDDEYTRRQPIDGRQAVEDQWSYFVDSEYRHYFGSDDIDQAENERFLMERDLMCLGFDLATGSAYTMKFWEMDDMKVFEPVLPQYTGARNTILSLWKKNMDKYLTVDECQEAAPPEYAPLVERVHAYLELYGHINCGLLSVGARRTQSIHTRKSDKKKIIVIGAGMAGVCVASQLTSFGHDVEIIEGRDRIGGRCDTYKAQECSVDLGASLILGFVGNPLATLVRQSGTPVYTVNTECPLFSGRTGDRIDHVLDERVAKVHNKLLDATSQLRSSVTPAVYGGTTEVPLAPMSKAEVLEHSVGSAMIKAQQDGRKIEFTQEEQELLGWHVAHLEYANATDLKNLSLAYWDQDDRYGSFLGDHVFLRDGYGTLVNDLLKNARVPVHTGVQVDRIDYSDDHDGVTVHDVDGKEWNADIVVCTASLGVLKSELLHFQPPLPQYKSDAINRLGFGNLNKVILYFDRVFWCADDMFGVVRPQNRHHGEAYMIWNLLNVTGKPVLSVLMAGNAAYSGETLTNEEAVDIVMGVLRTLYSDEDVPSPVHSRVTKWHADEFARGSYSYVAKGSTGDDYDSLLKPLNGKLYFAGEATTRYNPATVVGAYSSGLKVAGDIESAYRSYDDAQLVASVLAEESIVKPVSATKRSNFFSADDFELARKRSQYRRSMVPRLARGIRHSGMPFSDEDAASRRQRLNEVVDSLLTGNEAKVRSEYDMEQVTHISDSLFTVDIDRAPPVNATLTLQEKEEMGFSSVANLPQVDAFVDNDDEMSDDGNDGKNRKRKRSKRAHSKSRSSKRERSVSKSDSTKRKRSRSEKSRGHREAHAAITSFIKKELRRLVREDGADLSNDTKNRLLKKGVLKIFKEWKNKQASKNVDAKHFLNSRRRRKISGLLAVYIERAISQQTGNTSNDANGGDANDHDDHDDDDDGDDNVLTEYNIDADDDEISA